jgi:hypothetical protein
VSFLFFFVFAYSYRWFLNRFSLSLSLSLSLVPRLFFLILSLLSSAAAARIEGPREKGPKLDEASAEEGKV